MTQAAPKILSLCRVCHEPLGSASYRLINVVACVHHGSTIKHPCAKTRRHVPFGGLRVHDGCEARYVGCSHLIISAPIAPPAIADAFERTEWTLSRVVTRAAQVLCLQ
jgi:hypothetical protein